MPLACFSVWEGHCEVPRNLRLLCSIALVVTSLMKDQVESFGSEVMQQRDQVQRRAPSTCKLMLALAPRGCSLHLTTVKCLKGLQEVPCNLRACLWHVAEYYVIYIGNSGRKCIEYF